MADEHRLGALSTRQLRAVVEAVRGASETGARRSDLLFDASPAPTLVASLDDGIVLDANTALRDVIGLTKSETVGRPLADLGLFPGDGPADLARHDASRVVEIADRGPGAPPRSVRFVRVSSRRIAWGDRGCRVYTFADVTREHHAREALHALERFGAALASSDEFDELVRQALRNLIAQLDLGFGTCQAITPDGTRYHSFEGEGPEPLRERMRTSLPPGTGTMGLVARTGRPHVVPDHGRFEFAVPEALALGIVTTLTLPVKVGGETRFVLTVGSLHRQVELGADAIETAMAYVRRLEHALERVAYLQETEATREATFRALGLALEQRGLEAPGHMDRVVSLGTAFAHELGLSADETQALTWGAYLHDVGKIGIADAILLKPAPLTAAEVADVRHHTLNGIALIGEIPFLPTGTRQVVRSHHERWDGSGYPDGLAGAAIPSLARTFSLVHAFDVLTNERPHRRPWSVARALREIARASGARFDPDLVAPFVGAVRASAG
jgi:HD-GYP domain-containing protein (c-di-GMP phosphodiesterase class II)